MRALTPGYIVDLSEPCLAKTSLQLFSIVKPFVPPLPKTNIDVLGSGFDPSESVFLKPGLMSPVFFIVVTHDFLRRRHSYPEYSVFLKGSMAFGQKANTLYNRNMLQKVFTVDESARVISEGESIRDVPQDVGPRLRIQI